MEGLDYQVFDEVIDAKYWVPQHRERVFIVCFDRQVFAEDIPFSFDPLPALVTTRFKDILEDSVDEKYTLSDKLWNYLKNYAERHRKKGNGFGYGLADPEGIARTLSARYYKDGSEVLIRNGNGGNPRRLSPREAANLMGFPRHLPIVVSDTQAYRQFGNGVVPAVVEFVGRQILKSIRWHLRRTGNGCLIKK